MRVCWICFSSEEETPHAQWVSPCRCSGDTKWAHERCLLTWITRKQVESREEGTDLPLLVVPNQSEPLSSDEVQRLLEQAGNVIKCPQCHTPYQVILPPLARNPITTLLLSAYSSASSFVDSIVVPYSTVLGTSYIFVLSSVTYGVYAVTTMCGIDDPLTEWVFGRHGNGSWGWRGWRGWVSLASMPWISLMVVGTGHGVTGPRRLERALGRVGLVGLFYAFIAYRANHISQFHRQQQAIIGPPVSSTSVQVPEVLTDLRAFISSNLAPLLSQVENSSSAPNSIDLSDLVRRRSLVLVGLMSLRSVYTWIYRQYMVPLFVGSKPLGAAASATDEFDTPILHYEDYHLVDDVEYEDELELNIEVQAGENDEERPLVDQPAQEQQPRPQNTFRFTLFSGLKALVIAWIYPTIAATSGMLLKNSYIGVRRMIKSSVIDDSSPLDTFMWNVLGGCTFSVLKDVAVLLYSRQKRQQRLSMKLRNYEHPTGQSSVAESS